MPRSSKKCNNIFLLDRSDNECLSQIYDKLLVTPDDDDPHFYATNNFPKKNKKKTITTTKQPELVIHDQKMNDDGWH